MKQLTYSTSFLKPRKCKTNITIKLKITFEKLGRGWLAKLGIIKSIIEKCTYDRLKLIKNLLVE